MVDSATPWDASLKVLLSEKPQDFASWILKGAVVKEKLLTEFTGRKVSADALLSVIYEGDEVLLHIEFQSENDASMAERLLEYNSRARREHKRDVYSCVIYLRQDGNVPPSPLIWTFAKSKEIMRFHFQSIEIAKLSADDVRQTNLLGLLPLMVLTKDGATHEKVEEILTKLEFAEQTDILQVAYTLFTLVLNKDDQRWLVRRMQSMLEPFRETIFYQEMTKFVREQVREEVQKEAREEALKVQKEAREEALKAQKETLKAQKETLKAIEEGLKAIEEERQKRLQDNRQTLINLVQKLFPSLIILARKQAENVTESSILQDMITKMLSANTLEEAIQCLVEVPDATEKHD